MNPLISIIIPTYNRAHLIGDTLDSILEQTFTNWECIIVDDGSTDDMDNVVKSYVDRDNRFKYFHRPSDQLGGGNAARNFGFLQCNGDYVNWFDSDDLMHEDHLKLHIENFEKHPDINLSCSKALVFENSIDTIVDAFFPEKMTSENLVYDLVTGNIFFLTPCSVWKNEDRFKDVLWDEKLLMAQESDLNYRRALKGITFTFIERTVFVRRGHDSIDSQTKNDVSKIQSQFDYFTKVFESLRIEHLNNNVLIFKKLKKYLLLRLLVFYSGIRVVNNEKAVTYSFKNRIKLLTIIKLVNLDIWDKIKIYIGINTIFYFKKGYSLIFFKKFRINE